MIPPPFPMKTVRFSTPETSASYPNPSQVINNEWFFSNFLSWLIQPIRGEETSLYVIQ